MKEKLITKVTMILWGEEGSFFWKEVATKINLKFGTKFTGQQAKEKFQGIVRDCHVSKIFN